VAVKIKLKRMGKIRAPFYRIIVADARTKRDGRAIEEIGKYHPKADPSLIEVDSDRAQYWLSVGAQPTDPVRKLLEITGDWQKFKGLPGAEGTLKTATPRPDKKDAFAAAVAETVKELKPKAGGKAGDAKSGDAKAADGKAEPKADRGKARKPTASAGKAASEPEKPASTAKAGAAKDAAAKAEPAKETTAKAGAGKADAAKAGAGKADAAKADAGKADAAKADAAAKGTTAKGDSAAKGKGGTAKGDDADGASEAAAAGEEAAVAATPAGRDSEA